MFSVFYTALLQFREDKKNLQQQQQEQWRSDLSEAAWVTAVVQGAGDSSPRWRHTLMIGALLLASTSHSEEPLFSGMRQKLEVALVRSSNLAMQEPDGPDSLLAVIFVLNHTFPLLSDVHRVQLNYDLLLPNLIDTTFFSREGLEHGYWIGTIDQDVKQVGQKFNWSARSGSSHRVQEIKSRPLVASLGALSRLLGHAIDHVNDRTSILRSVERLSEFANNLATAWRQNKLSEVDQSEETQYLDQETLNTTLPALLHILRDTMFATIITLRSVLGRLLVDPFLASNVNAPILTGHCLHILHNMYFISHRFGQTSSSQYVFVNFTAIDILNQYPPAAENLVATIKPSSPGQIPIHPLDRLHDLFFLNTSEHFTLTLSASTNESLLQSALPYIQAQGDHRLGEIYEAAHSLTLAVFSAPQNAELVPRHVPVYVETLMSSFPAMLNARQFRLAIKSIVRLAAPQSTISRSMPMMQAVILDLLAQRMIIASEALLHPDPNVPIENVQPLSEKAVLLLSAIDSLPHLPATLLEDWLPISADLLHKMHDPMQKIRVPEAAVGGVEQWGDGRGESCAVCQLVGQQGRQRIGAVWRSAGRGGFHDEWSCWTREQTVIFERQSHGKHVSVGSFDVSVHHHAGMRNGQRILAKGTLKLQAPQSHAKAS